ncbi:hypothetical protein GT347_01805 [Xylophilus rhododendri]|uniref:histidine kinase n=1 Tax=Xylophilus rhododendri TaxID=2697032 RepID=A0A857IZ20_9BURK|nr:HAMP domain-containing histidine kinase [Xylophilus rhododendri]QHI96834.1 hypothetical protein GT347_01805 [Xylophilus rhododendri]
MEIPITSIAVCLPAGFVHSLRTPLGALTSALEVAQMPVDEEMRNSAQAIARRQALRLGDLVSELEAYCHLQRMVEEGDEPTLLPADLAPLVMQLWARAASAVERAAEQPELPAGLLVLVQPELLRPALSVLVHHAVVHGLQLEGEACGDWVELRAGFPDTAPAFEAGDEPFDGGPLELARRTALLCGGTLQVQRGADRALPFCLRLQAASLFMQNAEGLW